MMSKNHCPEEIEKPKQMSLLDAKLEELKNTQKRYALERRIRKKQQLQAKN